MESSKYKGLDQYQAKVLDKTLSSLDRDLDGVRISFSTDVSLWRMNSLWYGGDVACIAYKGYRFCLSAQGEVAASLYDLADEETPLITVKDQQNKAVFRLAMTDYLRSDIGIKRALENSSPEYRLELDANNWWDCSLFDPHGNWYDLEHICDTENLFMAVAEVVHKLDDIIAAHKKQSA